MWSSCESSACPLHLRSPSLLLLSSPNVKLSNCLLSCGDTPKVTPQRTPRTDPGFVLPSLLFYLIPPLSHLFILLFKNTSFLTSCCCFSLFHISPCPLKGKPSCFTHPGSPSVPVVAIPGIITLLISTFFLALQFLSRAVAGKQVYTNLPKLDKMNVQLFLFLAACFSLHQNCSCTLPW